MSKKKARDEERKVAKMKYRLITCAIFLKQYVGLLIYLTMEHS